MTILTAPKTWRRSPSPAKRAPELTPEEQAAVRRALVFLRAREGGMAQLAAALGVGSYVLGRALWKNGKPGVLLALRTAKAAGVSAEAVLTGAWPANGACPHCGR